MCSKQMVNVSEGICFRLANVVSSQRQSEQTIANLFELTMTEL